MQVINLKIKTRNVTLILTNEGEFDSITIGKREYLKWNDMPIDYRHLVSSIVRINRGLK